MEKIGNHSLESAVAEAERKLMHVTRDAALMLNIRRDKIELLIRNVDEVEPLIRIFVNKSGESVYFARAVFAAVPFKQPPNKSPEKLSLKSSEIEFSEMPAEVLIHEPRVTGGETLAKYEQYEQIAKYLPQFIDSIKPEAKFLPILIYDSPRNYRERNPVARIALKGSVVVNTG